VNWQRIVRLASAALLAFSVVLPQTTIEASAASGDRTLYLYYTHTKETARITFKRNGKYDQKGLAQLNQFLRDWRRNEPAKMDPALFDLIWQVYQDVGATQPVHIVSAYRSPKTNEMLRSKSSGVAENSQHTKGKAMDFFIPGIPLPTLRAAAMKRQVGGVGFYPTSGSPFVHLDTGNVRAWPRMNRAQLQKIFPDGRTLHLPAEGKPLSEDGRRYAQAEWQKCHSVPCGSGGGFGNDDGGSGRTLVGMLFGGGDDQPAPLPADDGPTQRPVQTVAVPVPVPAERPAHLGAAVIQTASLDQAAPEAIPFSTVGSAPLEDVPAGPLAPVPARKSEALLAATSAGLDAPVQENAVMAIAALDAQAPVPAPRVLMSEPPAVPVTAYLPDLPQDPEAQKALEMIIARETTGVPKTATAAPEPAQTLVPAAVHTASLNTGVSLEGLKTLVDRTWGAVSNTATNNQPMALALAKRATPLPEAALPENPAALVAPDLEHVIENFGQPSAVAGSHFAVLFEAGEDDFAPAAVLGRHAGKMAFGFAPSFEQNHRQFATGSFQLIANR